MDFWEGVFMGFLLTLIVLFIVVLVVDVANGDPCAEAEELLDSEIRVMHTISFSGSCKLITDQGFVFYHDGMLYAETDFYQENRK